MKIQHSFHWRMKRGSRPDITDDLIENAITGSKTFRDRTRDGVMNAIARVPPSGRMLKVAYKRKGDIYRIITAYWLD